MEIQRMLMIMAAKETHNPPLGNPGKRRRTTTFDVSPAFQHPGLRVPSCPGQLKTSHVGLLHSGGVALKITPLPFKRPFLAILMPIIKIQATTIMGIKLFIHLSWALEFTKEVLIHSNICLRSDELHSPLIHLV